jgi:hypothetical protein
MGVVAEGIRRLPIALLTSTGNAQAQADRSPYPGAANKAGGRVNTPFYAAAAVTRTSAGARFLRAFGAAPAIAPRGSDVARHIVLSYRPGWQSLADLNEISGHINDIDPTIRTFIVSSIARNSVTRRQAAHRMGRSPPDRGRRPRHQTRCCGSNGLPGPIPQTCGSCLAGARYR